MRKRVRGTRKRKMNLLRTRKLSLYGRGQEKRKKTTGNAEKAHAAGVDGKGITSTRILSRGNKQQKGGEGV